MTQSQSSILNFTGGEWKKSSSYEMLEVVNPANAKTLTLVPLSTPQEVEQAAQEAHQAFEIWKRVPPTERIQYLFRLKELLEEHIDDLACTITIENGKHTGAQAGNVLRHPSA